MLKRYAPLFILSHFVTNWLQFCCVAPKNIKPGPHVSVPGEWCNPGPAPASPYKWTLEEWKASPAKTYTNPFIQGYCKRNLGNVKVYVCMCFWKKKRSWFVVLWRCAVKATSVLRIALTASWTSVLLVMSTVHTWGLPMNCSAYGCCEEIWYPNFLLDRHLKPVFKNVWQQLHTLLLFTPMFYFPISLLIEYPATCLVVGLPL